MNHESLRDCTDELIVSCVLHGLVAGLGVTADLYMQARRLSCWFHLGIRPYCSAHRLQFWQLGSEGSEFCTVFRLFSAEVPANNLGMLLKRFKVQDLFENFSRVILL